MDVINFGKRTWSLSPPATVPPQLGAGFERTAWAEGPEMNAAGLVKEVSPTNDVSGAVNQLCLRYLSNFTQS